VACIKSSVTRDSNSGYVATVQLGIAA